MKNLMALKNTGTPKTLREAVTHALECQGGVRIQGSIPLEKILFVEAVLKDFLAQKFTPDLMVDPKVQYLWQKVRGAA